MTKTPREVLLVGSVPVEPVGKVFEVVAEHLDGLVKRIPDGERMGWLRDVWRAHITNQQLERGNVSRLNSSYPFFVQLLRPKAGISADEVKLNDYGYAKNARVSYAEFKRLRDAGKIPQGVRYQITMAGPGTTTFMLEMDGAKALAAAVTVLKRELDGIFAAIPAEDVCIHLDVAMEAEHEEYLRAPGRFDTPIHESFHWTREQMVDAVANVADHVPPAADLGFHICSIWHHDPAGGQDNRVLVEAVNALSARIKRPIQYFHFPIIPEHDTAEDYAPLKDLKMGSGTRLILGLLNLADGLEGARKRIALAETVVKDFGISFYCGLGIPTSIMTEVVKEMGVMPRTPELEQQVKKPNTPLLPRTHRGMNDPVLGRATADTLLEVLQLHREAALL